MSLKIYFMRAAYVLLLCTASVLQAHAADEEGITLDPQTGDYIVTYRSGYSGKLQRLVFVPSTKIDPSLKSTFKYSDTTNIVSYQYLLKSKKTSRQNISMLLTSVSNLNQNGQSSPPKWDGTVAPTLGSLDLRLAWNYRGGDYLGGLRPSESISGFALESNDLPGVVPVKITGAAPVTQWIGHYPQGVVGDQLEDIEKKDFISLPAAVPRISVPTPYDAATVLTNIQKHLDTDLVSMKLVDPTLVAQMDPWFATAIDAAKRNNTVALRNALQELRRLLKQECADVDQEGSETETDDKPVAPARIAKLAARALNFDLKYVGSRI